MNKKKQTKLSAIIVVKNEEEKIKDCLESLKWVDEVILVDNGSTDNTIKIAKEFNCKIFKYKNGTFSERKNFGAEKANGEWLLFMDADERIDSSLREEIKSKTHLRGERTFTQYEEGVFAIPRRNIILGREFKQGGQWPDYVIRFIKKNNFIRWSGELHEQPEYKGVLQYLKNPLIHYKHANLHEMVVKTNDWSGIEGQLMFDANHPQMNLVRFFTAILREFLNRFIKEKAYLDGTEGIMYGIYQIFSRFLSYARLWELQIQNRNLQLRTQI